VYILLELCTNQTLNEILRRRKRLHELEIQSYTVQIVSALKYMHAHKVIHRDLKLGNLFINDKMQIKIGDFGLATKLEFDGDRKRTICGTPNYIAPEILEGKNGHSYEVDTWSLGVIIYTLLIGKPPFETSDVKTTYKKIKQNNYCFPESPKISPQAKDLVKTILTLDPEKRPSLNQILEHEFFHMGVAIPKNLPSSTLACPPSSTYIEQFMPSDSAGSKTARTKPAHRMGETAPAGFFSQRGKENKSERNSDALDKSTLEAIKKEIAVLEYVDYSAKYGVGYLLSDNCFGVFFNDSTKIVYDPENKTFNYLDRKTGDREEEI
jgi:polo-like kinase 1